jgi:hypothetical protein
VTPAVEEFAPYQWTEQYPGTFRYAYQLHTSTRRSLYLAVNSTAVNQMDLITGPAPPTLDFLNLPSFVMAGEPLSLHLRSSVIGTEFASLAASSTGWRVQLLRPDNSSADLGLMADWEVWQDSFYKWNMTVPGTFLQQVRSNGVRFDTYCNSLSQRCLLRTVHLPCMYGWELMLTCDQC